MLDSVRCIINDGDTSWVMVSTVLVLAMMPSLALFEAGLLRRKDTLTILVQIFSGLSVLSVMWVLFGYSLTFGPDHGGVIGDFSNGLFLGVGIKDCSKHAPTIPHALFALFQMMFAAISPLLMTGAYAERLKFVPFLIYTVLWEIIVYYPIAHMIWGGGWLDTMNCLDFAGGIVIHTSAGTASIVLAIVLGKRKDFSHHHGEVPPSNTPLACIGAALLWMGWFGFNAGSALSGASLAVQAVLNTQVASTMSATVWLFMIMAQRKKPSIVALINGAIAGLAGITPASGYVSAQSALVIGIVLGLSSYWSIYLLKHKLKIDDALDVASVHGVTGIVGSFAIGICADKTINESGENGWIYGNPRQMGIQTLGIVVAGVWSALVTLVLALIIKRFSKTSEEDEKLGLDEVEIEEKYAYNYHKDQLMHQLEQIVHEEEIEKEEHEANQVIITENVNSTYESGLKSRHHDEQSPLIE